MLNKTITFLNHHSKKVVLAFFVLFFISGFSIYKDYGLSWDEGMQWKSIGLTNYNYVIHGDKESLLASGDKYHGPAFELGLVMIEKLLKLKDTREVYLMRHLVNFLVFFVSLVFLYLLLIHLFKDWKLALAGCLMYVLSPRIFAESFYNSKDIILLSFFVIGLYSLFLFHQKQTYLMALVHAFICGFAIVIRIIAIVLPLLSIVFLFLEIGESFYSKRKPKIVYGSFVVFFISLIAFIYLFWPVLWEDPIYHFKNAFKEMSLYQWDSNVLYLGENIDSRKIPWHYLPVWIAITTPVFYLFLFGIGLIKFFTTLLGEPIQTIKNKKNTILIIICFFTPILSIIVLNSVVYDAWRHVFFIYAAFILIAVMGIQYLFQLASKIKFGNLALTLLLLGSFARTSFTMIQLHPFQNVYFNYLAGTDYQKIKQNFEMDYWGLSSRKALEEILKVDFSEIINVKSDHLPGVLNQQILPFEQRKRLYFTDDLEDADYFIGDYRGHPKDYPYQKEIFSVKVENAKLVSVFKLLPEEKIYKPLKGKILLTLTNDFESPQAGWGEPRIKAGSNIAHSGEWITYVDSIQEFSSGLALSKLDSLFNRDSIGLNISFWEKNIAVNSEAVFVVSLETFTGKSYYWHALKRLHSAKQSERGVWLQKQAQVVLPPIKSPNDIMKIYLWNNAKKTILMDDVEIEFVGLRNGLKIEN